jgi:hypothetical protein
MFGSTNTKALVHLPRAQSRDPEQHLPRGECRFILPEVDADGSRQRCSCASYSLKDGVPGALCGCGHQAWHHIQEPTSDFVPVEEYMLLLDRFKKLEDSMKGLQEDMKRERKERDRIYSNMVQMLRGSYGNMAYLRYYVDEKLEIARIQFEDKIEGVLDRATGAAEEVDKLKTRVSDLDETSIRLEERMDSGRWPGSRSLTPLLEGSPRTPKIPSEPMPMPITPKLHTLPPISSLPLRSRSQEKPSEAWTCRAILVPKKTQRFAFAPESKAHMRCQSRGLHQDLHLETKNSESFIQCIEASFETILRGRPWMPLQCLRSSDMSLGQLTLDQRNPIQWDYSFLESQCMAHDKMQGEIIYLALMHEELGWPDIHSLPRLFGSDETCWELDDELDGKALNARMDYKMDMEITQKSLETDSMYEYSPPPYSSSRTHSDTNSRPTALDVLAGTASYLANSSAAHSSGAPSISERSTFSDRSIDSALYEEDDEHRDKRTKHGALRPQPQTPHGLSPGLSSPPQQKMYYSGRAKRKINPLKQKEPLDWRVSEMKLANPMKGMFHRKHGESKDDQQSQPLSEEQRREQEAYEARSVRSL